MDKPVTVEYLKGLGEILTKMEASDVKKKKLTLEEGLDQAVGIVAGQANKGKKVIFIGNGGSAAIASHQSVDYWKNGNMRAIAFNDTSLLTCISNDYGYPYVFEKPIEMFADAGDVLIAISSSGKSENILRGVKAARGKKCSVITMSGFGTENPLRAEGDVNFFVPSPDSYGYVEIAHLAICHCIVDTIIRKELITPAAKRG